MSHILRTRMQGKTSRNFIKLSFRVRKTVFGVRKLSEHLMSQVLTVDYNSPYETGLETAG